MSSRRSLSALIGRIAVLAIGPLYLAGTSTEAATQEQDPRVEDLRERAIPMRSIDPADEDYSDLAPLAAAIGDARIVQLGESTHGDGAGFAAKARLVKFLHRELGFDVLLWESGMYDLRVVNDSLRAGFDPAAAARLGVFTIWSAATEVLPLFEYARDSHAGDRPLEMAGFDMQFSGRGASQLAEDLLRFASRIDDAELSESVSALAREAAVGFQWFLQAETARNQHVRALRRIGVIGSALQDSVTAWNATRQESFAPTPADLERFIASTGALLDLFARERAELERAHGEAEVAFMERVVGNLELFGTSTYERRFAGRPTQGAEAMTLQNRGWNRRDTRMADNVRWLADTRYPGRKLIIWAHNGHIMNAHYLADWSGLTHEPDDGGMKPMGAFLEEQMGDQVYTLGFTAFTGTYGLVTAPGHQPIREAPPGSLEALLHEVGHEQAFLDFRGLPLDHWLRQPATMAIRGYMPERMDDWTRVVDGMVFIDRMTPATGFGR